MILPTKHILPDRALLSVGADILRLVREPKTVSSLWDSIRKQRANTSMSSPIDYEWFILALDFLFIIGAVEYNRGLVEAQKS